MKTNTKYSFDTEQPPKSEKARKKKENIEN